MNDASDLKMYINFGRYLCPLSCTTRVKIFSNFFYRQIKLIFFLKKFKHLRFFVFYSINRDVVLNIFMIIEVDIRNS